MSHCGVIEVIAVSMALAHLRHDVPSRYRTCGSPLLAHLYSQSIFNRFGSWIAICSTALVITVCVSVARADPLDTWTQVPIAGTYPSFSSVTFAGGLFVASGSAGDGETGVIGSSYDGSNWSMQYVRSDAGAGIAYGNGVYVLVGNYNSVEGWEYYDIWASTNGTNWTSALYQFDPGWLYLRGVTYGNGRFIAIGESGTIFSSSDGFNWTEHSGDTNAFPTGIAYGDGLFVATSGSSQGAIISSSDGLVWTQCYAGSGPGTALNGIIYGGGQFVATGNNGTIVSSTDGVNWVPRSSGVTQDLGGICYGGGQFVADGNGDEGGNVIISSADGINWKLRYTDPTYSLPWLGGVAYGEGRFVVTAPSSGFVLESAQALSGAQQATVTLTTLVSFKGTNGSHPEAGLVQGNDGNFYGTTAGNVYGTNGISPGMVFRMTPNGNLTELAFFNGADGGYPVANLIEGSNSVFYGTTESGGAGPIFDVGTVFEVTSSGTLTTLISFDGSNGGQVQSGLVQGHDGNFYGTTFTGGLGFVGPTNAGEGTIFKLTHYGELTSLVSFYGTNGAYPSAGLVQATDGNFYGTTSSGGLGDYGTIFKVTSAGVLTTLFSFNYWNGSVPVNLVQGSDGDFYGTTAFGGGNGGSYGTIFKVTSAGVLTTLVSFNYWDGSDPVAGLVEGSDGNFYGTTQEGGANGNGTIFEVTPTGT